ncbi:MAG: winged helix-turn-helix domain-containing protein [Bacteroidia bacterium]
MRALGGSAKPREITKWIADKFNISDKILNERYEKSGVLKFQNQLAWARQYLVWEELLESSKHGVWTLSKKGWSTKLNESQAHDIFLKWVKIFQDLREKKPSNTIESESSKIIQLQEESEPGNFKPSLIDVLQNLSPRGFEELCGRLLREYDFEILRLHNVLMMKVLMGMPH